MLGSVKCAADMGHYRVKEGDGEGGHSVGRPRMSAVALGVRFILD